MKERSILLVGGSVVIAVIVIIFLAIPASEDNTELKEELSQSNQELAMAEARLESARKLIKDYGQVTEAEKASLNKRFPSHSDVEALVVQLENMAISSQVLITGVSFDEETRTKGFSTLSFSIDVSGDYGSILDFISTLELNDRLITTQDMVFTPGELGIGCTISGKAYYSMAQASGI